jgi:hypothetical protein
MSKDVVIKFGLRLTPRAAAALNAAEFDLSDVRQDIALARRDPRIVSQIVPPASHPHAEGWLDYADEVVRVAAGATSGSASGRR